MPGKLFFNRVAIVSGAESGTDRATSLRLAKEGAKGTAAVCIASKVTRFFHGTRVVFGSGRRLDIL
jgi:NAD(P)-dependent dehydrogenase (short-subunit alcohol dehydrogenase family)